MDQLIGSLFTLLGGGLIVWQVLAMERAAESRKWPRAPGRILQSFVDKKNDSDGATYLVKVVCQYKVGDFEYVCSRLRFGLSLWNSRSFAYWSRALRKYTVGSDVEVSYNPRKPEESVLEPGFALTMLTGLAFGLAFFAIGILTLREGLV